MSLIDSEAGAMLWLREVLGIEGAAMARLERLAALLIEENARQNLVARASLDVVWQRHIVDSAQLLHVSRETLPDGAWLDLGTGAGFPGLVIAALQPERPITLVDSRRLRTDWLARAARVLDLPQVTIRHAKVEDLESAAYAVISARAFAPLDKLVAMSARFSTPETIWLLPKGAKARHELQELPATWRHLFHVEQSLTDRDAGIIVGRLSGGCEPVARAARARSKHRTPQGIR